MFTGHGCVPRHRPSPGRSSAPRFLALLVASGVLGCLLPTLAMARGPWSDVNPEGFSDSRKGLPRRAVSAWNATVLIKVQRVLGGYSGPRRLRPVTGCGVVVDVDERRRTAVVVTTGHAIRCADRICDIAVGLVAGDGSDEEVWTGRVRLTASDPGHDLAFLEVRLPAGVRVEAARLASTSCLRDGGRGVLAIGWPDLTVRQDWGVDPPANFAERVKRYSYGIYLTDIADYRAATASGGALDHMTVIFHNADVLPGNSGGPLVTTDGLVVGINSRVVGEGSPGHGYCARKSLLEDATGCAHLAISSEQVAASMKRLLSLPVKLVSCPADRDEPPVQAQLSPPDSASR